MRRIDVYKREYFLKAGVQRSERVLDYSEMALGLVTASKTELVLDPGAFPQPVTWDAPCHLCHGQGIRAEPLSLLASIEGLELVPLPNSEGCCGSAGIYSALRPTDSRAVLDARLDDLASSGARTLVTANPGCQLQWTQGLDGSRPEIQVIHLAECLAAARAARATDT
jgi:glycolate oxidase iron-sulfur subunit